MFAFVREKKLHKVYTQSAPGEGSVGLPSAVLGCHQQLENGNAGFGLIGCQAMQGANQSSPSPIKAKGLELVARIKRRDGTGSKVCSSKAARREKWGYGRNQSSIMQGAQKCYTTRGIDTQ